ncbi:MAG: hypothetical protein ACLFQM_07245 [Fidelibacterota bacterium]
MLRKKILKIIMLMALSCGLLSAGQDNTRLDSILNWEKLIIDQQQGNPLSDKKYGIEANILRLFYMNESVSFSGGFSLFDVSRNAEISFPVFYEKPEEGITKFTTECHYRHFLSNTQNGLYIAGFTRLDKLNGTEKIVNKTTDQRPKGNGALEQEFMKGDNISHLKFGIGVGIGFRRFSPSGIYWGCSLNVGRYILGENDVFYHDALVDSKYIVSAELLKFGVAF